MLLFPPKLIENVRMHVENEFLYNFLFLTDFVQSNLLFCRSTQAELTHTTFLKLKKKTTERGRNKRDVNVTFIVALSKSV